MSKVAIIAIGYNKVRSLLRLLNSLNHAEYGEEQVPLIISLDYSGSEDVKEAATQFEWKHGTKEIRAFSERQGLKKHILSCGDYLNQYEAVYIFEDDIVVSPYFYLFGQKCIEVYENTDEIAGVSLYSPQWNQNSNFPFEPVKSEYDTYFMKYAQSWGQIWFRKEWRNFTKWYHENTDFFEKGRNKEVPRILYTWGENSWLKFHIAYCAVKKKYFVYPYYSFTTVFVENGTHFGTDITRYHSSFHTCDLKYFQLSPFHENAVCYDVFFENEKIKTWLDKRYADVTIDLYGCQSDTLDKRYLLSTRKLPFAVEKVYGLQFRPIEMNVRFEVEGDGIYLYDTSVRKEKIKKREVRENIIKRWDYFMKERFMLLDELLPVSWEKGKNLLYSIFKHKK